jgi:hypothetical protein
MLNYFTETFCHNNAKKLEPAVSHANKEKNMQFKKKN